MIIKNNESFNFKKINLLFLKEVLLSESFCNTLVLIVFAGFLLLFSKIFRRNFNLSSNSCERLMKNLNPKNIFNTLGIDEKKGLGVNKFNLNLSKKKLQEFFFSFLKHLWLMLSFSWLITFFAKLRKLLEVVIQSTGVALVKYFREINNLFISLRFDG